MVRGDVEAVVAVGRTLEFAASQDLDAIVAHDPGDPALPDMDAQFVQFLCHARAAIAPQAEPVLFADMRQEDHVAPLTP